jgi:probable rRNA maturation factor
VTLEVEVIGVDSGRHGGLTAHEVEQLCALALASAGLEDGHVAVEFVDEARIRELNREYRGRDRPTDVLSFPVDEDGVPTGPRELGDVVICPPYASDLREAVIHGVLHLTGMDHETDGGEMLALQAELLSWTPSASGRSPSGRSPSGQA